MKCVIEFDMNNDAFDGFPEVEAGRLLDQARLHLGVMLQDSGLKKELNNKQQISLALIDSNGNTVGTVSLTNE